MTHTQTQGADGAGTKTAGDDALPKAVLAALDRFRVQTISGDVEPRDDDTWAVIDTKAADPMTNWPGELVSEHPNYDEARIGVMKAVLAVASGQDRTANRKLCPSCQGSRGGMIGESGGSPDWDNCWTCNGEGFVPAPAATPGVPDSLREALEFYADQWIADCDAVLIGPGANDWSGGSVGYEATEDLSKDAGARARKALRTLAAHPAGQAGDAGAVWKAVADRVVTDVCELPDRTSPEDWPEAMLVTGDELHGLIVQALADLAPDSTRTGQGEEPCLRAVIEVHSGRTDTRLTFGKGMKHEGGCKAVEQAIIALRAELDQRDACPAAVEPSAGYGETGAKALNAAILAQCASPRICSGNGRVTEGLRCGPCERKALEAAIAARPAAPEAAAAIGDLGALQRAAEAGRLRIKCHERFDGAHPDAGMVWPIEVELPCINGLSAWFTLGNIYSPDQAAQGYTDGALSDDLARSFADHIVRSLTRPAAPEAQGAWSFDMEAAPRDGASLLCVEYDEPEKVVDLHWFRDGGTASSWRGSFGQLRRPIAWCRLPAPPASSGQEG